MKTRLYRTIINGWLVTTIGLLSSLSWSESMQDYTAYPESELASTVPKMMLGMSVDHTLFSKAYSDLEDLNNDGVLDITYDHSIDYYGYFESDFCYDYSSVSEVFSPASHSTNKYCSGNWSGNFLNWATMTKLDLMKKILFGGTRALDESITSHGYSSTILERVYLPYDAHSFSKYYGGSDIKQLTPFSVSDITFCSTSEFVNKSGAYSHTVTGVKPIIRVAEGDYRFWGANERAQCLWREDTGAANSSGHNKNNPSITGVNASDYAPNRSGSNDASLGEKEYVMKLTACSNAGLLEGHCRTYPDGTTKPAGVLQAFGEDNSLHFGLITGSWVNNKQGGMLRKSVASFTDEVNVDTGSFINTNGIINTLDSFKLWGFTLDAGQHGGGFYNKVDKCPWGKKDIFNNGVCMNWGNPIAEIAEECYRYMSGESGATASYTGTDKLGLPTDTWDASSLPVEPCDNFTVLLLNAGSPSFDNDNISAAIDAYTDKIGETEGIHGNRYFVGESGSDNDGQCTAKTITALSDAQGVCPGASDLKGGYGIAGLAYKAHVEDNRAIEDDQLITTYAVDFAQSAAGVSINIDGRKLEIIPACYNKSNNTGTSCALVDMQILSDGFADLTGKTSANMKIYANWEDSISGGDFDQDMWGVIDVTWNAPDSLVIDTKVVQKSTPFKMGFGFVISGTKNDGIHLPTGINEFNCSSNICPNATNSFTLSSTGSSAEFLETPLFYASKWGGFTDSNNNGIPDLQKEWDSKNNDTGANGADGLPDNYYRASNPGVIAERIEDVFRKASNIPASGSGAAVVSNTETSVGATYDVLYYDKLEESGNEVVWVGDIQSVFIDNKGQLREDSNGNKSLDEDYSTDKAVKIVYDDDYERTIVKYLSYEGENALGVDQFVETGSIKEVSEFKPIWRASDAINNVTDLVNQRNYGDKAYLGRHILTAMDTDNDGLLKNSDVIDFSSTSLDYLANKTWLNRFMDGKYDLSDSTELATFESLIDWTRGKENKDYRNRTVDVNGDGRTEVMRIGDIVHSSPAVVSTPSDGYDVLLNDPTYLAFQDQYLDRRRVVYVGANDGMIHAFNGGFYNKNTATFETNSGIKTQHPLGSELWAYIPQYSLPMLRWIADPDYTHIYTVDGDPITFDARVFDDDADHPHGWGTVLIVGMRMGGKAIEIDHNGDGVENSNDITLRSSYVVLDITNPEKAPVLMAEISHEALGLTTSKPSLIKKYIPSVSGFESPAYSEWSLVMGSGPIGSNELNLATSEQNAKLFVFDLKTKKWKESGGKTLVAIDVPEAEKGIVGDLYSVDWDTNGVDDVVYFGTSTGDNLLAQSGNLYRINLEELANSWASRISTVMEIDKPVLSKPLKQRENNDFWLYFGTGRLFVNADRENSEQQYFIAVKEALDTNGEVKSDDITLSDLVDTSKINVFLDKSLKTTAGGDVQLDGETIESVSGLASYIANKKGWYRPLGNTSNPSDRVLWQATYYDETLLFPVHTPSALVCDSLGESVLMVLEFDSGVANADHFASVGYVGKEGVTDVEDADTAISTHSAVIAGSLSQVAIHGNEDGSAVAVGKSSSGETFTLPFAGEEYVTGRQSWREIDILF